MKRLASQLPAAISTSGQLEAIFQLMRTIRITRADIPNLIVSSTGRGFLSHISSRITLSPGPLSIFDADGSAVIVHLNPDRGQPGVTGASGGPRIACGVIQLVSDDDDNFNIGR